MIAYRRKSRQPIKWILAVILFVLAMTITFDDVEGTILTDSQGRNTPTDIDLRIEPPADEPPLSAPTITSGLNALLLKAGGLGSLYLVCLRK